MRVLVLAAAAVLLVVMQGSWVYRLGLPLDLPLLLTLATAWWQGRAAGTATGFWCGALVGAMTGTSLLFACLYGLVGWSAATLLRVHPHRGLLRAIVLGAGAALSFQGLECLIWLVVQHAYRIDPGLVLAQLLWNGLAMGLLVWSSQPHRRRMRAGRSRAWTADWQPVVYGA